MKSCRQGGEVVAKGVGVQAFHHGFRGLSGPGMTWIHTKSIAAIAVPGTDVFEPPRGGCLGTGARFSRVSRGQLGQLG